MSVASLLDGLRGHGYALLGWVAAHNFSMLAAFGLFAAALFGTAIYRRRRQQQRGERTEQ